MNSAYSLGRDRRNPEGITGVCAWLVSCAARTGWRARSGSGSLAWSGSPTGHAAIPGGILQLPGGQTAGQQVGMKARPTNPTGSVHAAKRSSWRSWGGGLGRRIRCSLSKCAGAARQRTGGGARHMLSAQLQLRPVPSSPTVESGCACPFSRMHDDVMRASAPPGRPVTRRMIDLGRNRWPGGAPRAGRISRNVCLRT
jgi:hypothetical protein